MSVLSAAARSPDPANYVLPEEFRSTMRQHAAGVAVITTYRRGPVGFCATSLSSLSLDPPIVSFAVAGGSASGQAWTAAAHGIVHLLRADQAEMAAAFARSGRDKFTGTVRWRRGPYGQPLIDGVLAWMVVSPRTRLPIGDHLLVICDVREASAQPGPSPLLHHAGGYHGLRTLPPQPVFADAKAESRFQSSLPE
jgi:flavin reductase (DIM6/NTAB) family NADH-FMN oxidoreductase RutF